MSFGKDRKSNVQRLSLQVHNPPDADDFLTDDEEEGGPPPLPPDDDDNHDDRKDPDYKP